MPVACAGPHPWTSSTDSKSCALPWRFYEYSSSCLRWWNGCTRWHSNPPKWGPHRCRHSRTSIWHDFSPCTEPSEVGGSLYTYVDCALKKNVFYMMTLNLLLHCGVGPTLTLLQCDALCAWWGGWNAFTRVTKREREWVVYSDHFNCINFCPCCCLFAFHPANHHQIK